VWENFLRGTLKCSH